jgi:hypothetical protein
MPVIRGSRGENGERSGCDGRILENCHRWCDRYNSSVLSFFDPPTWWFNFFSFAIGVVGTGMGVYAIIVALAQLKKSVDASEAAQKAAEATARELNALAGLTDVYKLTRFSAEVLAAIDQYRFGSAAWRAQDLRIGLADLSESPSGHALRTPIQWNRLIATLSIMQQDLQQAEGREDTHATIRLRYIGIMRDFDHELHVIAAMAAHQ